MSLGLSQLMYESLVPSTGVPSMMYKGSLFWNELMPRTRTVLREPGEPLFSTVTPETRPSSRWSTLADVCFCAFSTLTLATAPVMSPRRCVW